MNFEEAFARLSEEQKIAVTHIDGPMMVLAGPGTGKTQIIALRIARILQETQLAPYNVLCLTFTESGVTAMRRRLFDFIGTEAYSVRVATFHAFCNELIKENPEKFLFARELEPLTEIERIQLFRALLDELPEGGPIKPFADPYFYQRDLIKAIQDLKREDWTPAALDELLDQMAQTVRQHDSAIEAFTAIHGGSLKSEEVLAMQTQLQGTFLAAAFADMDLDDKKSRTQAKNNLKALWSESKTQLPKQKALVDLYRRYQNALQKRGRYDYEDMILFALDKLKTDSELLATLQERYQYILVDEYQDTNGAQNELVRLLGSYYENPNIFVVGDDKQSIYRFQGASLENMLEFYRSYQNNIELVTLQENYRSQQLILNAATGLIRHSENGLEQSIPELKQNLLAKAPHPEQKLRLAELETPQDECHFLAEEVKNLLTAGTDPSQIAIFFRNNRDSQALVDCFLRLHIPFHLYAGKNLLEDSEIQKLLRLFTWLADPLHDRELFFILNIDFLGFDPLEVLKLTRLAADRKTGLWDLLEIASEPLKNFHKKTAEWLAAATNQTFTDFFERVLNESGYLKHILQKPDHLQHLHRLNTFFDQVKQWNRNNPKLRLQEFMEYLSLLQDNQIPLSEAELSTEKKAVALMTAHRSKGLEFEHVFIMQCNDKHWGNNPSRAKLKLPPGLLKTAHLTAAHKNEDERRLFYVALTRAKKSVTLTRAKQSETLREELPSLFLAELDPTLVQTARPVQTPLETQLLSNFAPVPQKNSIDEEAFVRSLLQNYSMSFTHLNNYLRCPRIFYYENLLRVPRAKTKQEAFGTAVHEALKDLLANLHHQPIPSKDLLLESFEHHLKRELLLSKDLAPLLHFGRETLESYFENYKTSFHPSVLLEYSFASHHVHVEGVPITGKLDKIELLEPNSALAKSPVHLVDYKTSNPDSKAAELRPGGDYHRQIVFYQLLCDHSQEFPHKMLSGEIDFIQKSKKENAFIRRRIEVTEEDKQALIQTLKDTYADIQSLRFLHPDEFESCGECDYCKWFGKAP